LDVRKYGDNTWEVYAGGNEVYKRVIMQREVLKRGHKLVCNYKF
jgi:hypothetical protein